MRAIKFRAWSGDAMWLFTLSESRQFAEEELERWPLMQCTGLKDKNSVEIYKGDIIRLDNNLILTVSWEDDAFMLMYFGSPYSAVSYGAQNKRHWLEVIGNIYENPETVKAA